MHTLGPLIIGGRRRHEVKFIGEYNVEVTGIGRIVSWSPNSNHSLYWRSCGPSRLFDFRPTSRAYKTTQPLGYRALIGLIRRNHLLPCLWSGPNTDPPILIVIPLTRFIWPGQWESSAQFYHPDPSGLISILLDIHRSDGQPIGTLVEKSLFRWTLPRRSRPTNQPLEVNRNEETPETETSPHPDPLDPPTGHPT